MESPHRGGAGIADVEMSEPGRRRRGRRKRRAKRSPFSNVCPSQPLHPPHRTGPPLPPTRPGPRRRHVQQADPATPAPDRGGHSEGSGG